MMLRTAAVCFSFLICACDSSGSDNDDQRDEQTEESDETDSARETDSSSEDDADASTATDAESDAPADSTDGDETDDGAVSDATDAEDVLEAGAPDMVDGGPTLSDSDSGVDAGAVEDEPAVKEEVPCEVPAPTECPDPMPTYKDVRPLITERCVVCHYGEVDGPWTLDGYEHVANWHDLIRGAMLSCSMPPPDSDMTMTVEERVELLAWLRCGFPK